LCSCSKKGRLLTACTPLEQDAIKETVLLPKPKDGFSLPQPRDLAIVQVLDGEDLIDVECSAYPGGDGVSSKCPQVRLVVGAVEPSFVLHCS
jgi:hypothetical protein